MTNARSDVRPRTKPMRAAKSFADYPRPSVTVDVVIFTVLDADLKILLVKRNDPPFEGQYALPGGFVRVGDGLEDQGEDVDAAAARELAEETGLSANALYLEQLYTFGDANRDPRGRVITVAYYALIRPDLAPFVHAGGDAAEAGWRSVSKLSTLQLAFDHGRIIEKALERVRGKIDYNDIAFELVPRTFTIPELRTVHETIQGKTYDPGNFRRRFQRMMKDGIIVSAPGKRITSRKPARVYRFERRAP